MTRISFFVDQENIEALKKIAKETGAPISELIRRAIKKYLEENKLKEVTCHVKKI